MGRQPSRGHSTTSSISELTSTLDTLLDATLTKSSAKGYARAWTLFDEFATTYGFISVAPVQIQLLALFISYMFNKGYAASTIASHVSAIGYIHKMNDFPDPTNSYFIQKLINACRKLKPTKDFRLPITKNILHSICDAIPHAISNSYEIIMYRAMFLLAFYGFLRIGEFASGADNSNLSQLSHITLDQHQIVIAFSSFKHHTGNPIHLTIKASVYPLYCPVHCLKHYISARGNIPGPLFAFTPNLPISKFQFATTLKNCLSFTKFHIDNIKSHSFRIGMCSHCADMGMSDSQIRLLGRWKSDAFKSYIRNSSAK